MLASAPGRSTGADLFGRALAGGAQALAAGVAAIAPGAAADIVSLAPEHPALAGRNRDAALDSWFFAGYRGVVDCVWRGGRKVVEQGRHPAREAVAGPYRETIRSLLS